MNCQTHNTAISKIYREKNSYELNPPYQREAGIWSDDKKTKLIDSIFNRYDLPKFYCHDIRVKKEPFKYNVIDGKQRLSAIWDFMENKFRLGSNFSLQLDISNPPKPGDFFRDLSQDAVDLFREYNLDVVLVSEADEQDIEELFSRLNAGESLNAAEQRRALGGEMRDLIIEIGKNDFFTDYLGFNPKRYANEEIAAKLLKIEHSKYLTGARYCDLKKRHLDEMVTQNKTIPTDVKAKLTKEVTKNLNDMKKSFDKNDPHLSKQSYPQMYYYFCKHLKEDYNHPALPKKISDFMDTFKLLREDNNKLDENQREYKLAEYGRHAQQGTNDLTSMEWRDECLREYFLLENPDVIIRDQKRKFSNEERHTIWILGNKKCFKCEKPLKDLKEMDADHVQRWADGGQTKLENARALCVSCNRTN